MKKDKKEIIRREQHSVGVVVRERKEGEEASRTITGYAITFGQKSVPMYEDDEMVIREVIAPEAVTKEFLDGQDISMTMFHDRQLILARSHEGKGTLTYGVDEKGVWFEFEAPNTADGDKALELVRRGDLDGCSFAGSTYYWDDDYVQVSDERVMVDGGKSYIERTYTINKFIEINDMTIAATPAYPSTSVETIREVVREAVNQGKEEKEREFIEREAAVAAEAKKLRLAAGRVF